jgi:hypothetical protein
MMVLRFFLSSVEQNQLAVRAVLLRQLLQLCCDAGHLYMQGIKLARELKWTASYWFFDTVVSACQFGIDCFPPKNTVNNNRKLLTALKTCTPN